MKAMTTYKKRFVSVCIALFIFVVASVPVFADGPSGFGVGAVIPENQVDTDASWFDLRMAPGMEQTIQIEVSNSEDTAIIAKTSVNTASTSENGTIEFSEEVAPDPSMPINFRDFVTVPQPEVELQPGETALVDIQIKMPDTPFDGVLLGGVTVTAAYVEDPDAPVESQAGGFAISNEYARVIAIVLSENDNEVKPDFQLTEVEVGLNNLRPVATIRVQNAAPIYAKKVQINAEVTKKGSTEVLYNLDVVDAKMSPQTTGEFIIPLNESGAVEPGEYSLHMKLEWNGQPWEWDKDFTVEGTTAEEMNEKGAFEANEDTNLTALPIWVYVVLGACGVLILTLIIVLVIVFTKRSKKERKRNREAYKKEVYTRRK